MLTSVSLCRFLEIGIQSLDKQMICHTVHVLYIDTRGKDLGPSGLMFKRHYRFALKVLENKLCIGSTALADRNKEQCPSSSEHEL